MERWKNIQSALDTYHDLLAPSTPRFTIEHLTDRTWSNEQYYVERKRRPFTKAGVYLLFDEAETLLYVGMATGTFDDRIWSHDKWMPRRFTDVIVVEEPYGFLIPALELYLIRALKPTHNHQHNYRS